MTEIENKPEKSSTDWDGDIILQLCNTIRIINVCYVMVWMKSNVYEETNSY